MGMEALFCCFRGLGPKISAITGLGASVLSFAFLIWGLADLWFKRKGVHALYIITFVLVILALVGFALLFVFLMMTGPRAINNLGRTICLVIIMICVLAFIFMLISWIILIVYYADSDKTIDSHEWAAVFVPSLITLIVLPLMALVANYLYKEFTDRMNLNPTPYPVTQNTIPTIPNISQPEINLNINGPVPPMGNNVPYPVPIQQSGVNINK
jgi:ABC-type transport system involved in multi-copper enzyme maturation permease subunit